MHSVIQQIYAEYLQYAGTGDRTINKKSEDSPKTSQSIQWPEGSGN